MRKEIRPAEDCWQWPHDITCFKDLVISSFPPLTPSQMDTSKLGSFVLTTIPQFTTDAIYHTWTFCFLFCLFFFILNISFCIGVEPINNVVIVSSEQWRDSAIHIYVSILLQTPPSSRPHNIEQSSMCYTLLVIHFEYSSTYKSIPNSLAIPSPWQPWDNF